MRIPDPISHAVQPVRLIGRALNRFRFDSV